LGYKIRRCSSNTAKCPLSQKDQVYDPGYQEKYTFIDRGSEMLLSFLDGCVAYKEMMKLLVCVVVGFVQSMLWMDVKETPSAPC
jgi:hypothetical protein